jgi:DNA-binding NtrC family response regulator
VSAVDNCRAARNAASAGDVDLALIDIGLPDGDGAALALELAASNGRLRIILCSGLHTERTGEDTHPAIIARLAKPLSLDRLDALFHRACDEE